MLSLKVSSRFNSKLVRLKGERSSYDMRDYLSFNSKLVRLKGTLSDVYIPNLKKFQFQTGAIKSLDGGGDTGCKNHCFNSKLVRLKVFMSSWVDGIRKRFNSKLVRLKVVRPFTVLARYDCFNSKLVRLKVARGPGGDDGDEFQFQTGAIKRAAKARARLASTSFNSKLVRLKGCPTLKTPGFLLRFQFQTGAIKRMTAHMPHLAPETVSIPNWCD